jgi:hypothetical protein
VVRGLKEVKELSNLINLKPQVAASDVKRKIEDAFKRKCGNRRQQN